MKASFNLTPADIDVLVRIAKKRGMTVSAVLDTAISTAKFIDNAMEDDGKVLIRDKRGRMTRLAFER